MADTSKDDVVLTLTSREGQHHIHTSTGITEAWPGTNDGLFVGDDSWVAVLCGTQWGPVAVRVRHEETSPADIDQTWDMIGEWSLNCAHGTLTIQFLYGDKPELIMTLRAGWARLRLSVRDRMSGAAAQEPVTEVLEEHLLQIWPSAERRNPAVVHGPDEFGALYLQSL